MSPDEVVAYNVRRLREARGMTVVQLASILGTGLHRVYDSERPRAGAKQRPFLWTDLISLCYALDATLFELVLPPPGVDVDAGEVGIMHPPETVAAVEAVDPRLANRLRKDGRDHLAELVFGLDSFDDNALARLHEMADSRDRRAGRLLRQTRELLDHMLAEYEADATKEEEQ